MSNLARKHYEQRIETQQQTQVQVKTIKRHAKITPGEKFLAMLLAAFVIVMAVQIISTQVKIYEANKNIEDVKVAIQEQQKINDDMEFQVRELSSPEILLDKAKYLGLNLDPNKVRGIEKK